MSKIMPFKAIRPRKDLVDKIAALPYDVYNRSEAKEVVAKNPISFLSIDRAESLLPDEVSTYDKIVYETAAKRMWDMVSDGSFVREEKSCYYVYELIMNGRSQTGIAACASVDDYTDNVIKKHENTRAEKEKDRIDHVTALNAQTGPIFLAYRRNEVISALVDRIKAAEPLYAFTSEDGITHRVWIIENDRDIEKIREAFEGIKDIYIADGHHRCASAVRVSENKRKADPGYRGDEEFNFFLSVLFPDDELYIMDYNRVIKDLAGLSEEEFLSELEQIFDINKSDGAVGPKKKGQMGLCLKDSGWYELNIKPEFKSEDPVEGLDVSLLQKYVLTPILGIEDPKTDSRIDFVGGIRGLGELERRTAGDCVAAFSMYPTDIHELFAVADAGRLMPPKSTWFEPKLRSGIFIHEI